MSQKDDIEVAIFFPQNESGIWTDVANEIEHNVSSIGEM